MFSQLVATALSRLLARLQHTFQYVMYGQTSLDRTVSDGSADTKPLIKLLTGGRAYPASYASQAQARIVPGLVIKSGMGRLALAHRPLVGLAA